MNTNLFYLMILILCMTACTTTEANTSFKEHFECESSNNTMCPLIFRTIREGEDVGKLFKATAAVELCGPRRVKCFLGDNCVHLNHNQQAGGLVSVDLDLSAVVGQFMSLSFAVSALPIVYNVDPFGFLDPKIVEQLNRELNIRSCQVIVEDVDTGVKLVNQHIEIDVSKFPLPDISWTTPQYGFFATAKMRVSILSTCNGLGGILVDLIEIVEGMVAR